jgi:hypothetical protein
VNRTEVSAFVILCMADLIDSLQTSQDFLRRDPLSCAWGRFRSLNRLNREKRTESDASSRTLMTLIVLVTTGLLACAFYIYVLCQWTLDANGNRAPRLPIDGRSDGTRKNKRLYVVGSRKIPWNESERIAYRKIVNSLSSRNRRRTLRKCSGTKSGAR